MEGSSVKVTKASGVVESIAHRYAPLHCLIGIRLSDGLLEKVRCRFSTSEKFVVGSRVTIVRRFVSIIPSVVLTSLESA
jgi:hypothetical protein